MRIRQQIRGTTSENDSWIFPEGVITMDTELKQLRAHDGTTPGGNAIPNTGNIVAFGTAEFTAVATLSVPGAIADGDVGKLCRITDDGTYTLPTVSGKPVGSRMLVQALVSGVVLDPYSGESINEAGTDLSTTSINEGEILTLAVLDTSKWIVVCRH